MRVSWLATLFALAAGCQAAAPEAKPALGMNLDGPADWSTEQPFVDVFKLSRRWISQRQGAGWGKGPDLAVDARGWVTKLEPNCWAETPMLTIEGGRYTPGDYTVLYEGEGRLEVWGSATIKERAVGKLTLKVEPAKGPLWLRLMATAPANPVRNIRVVAPGCLETYKEQPFRADFLARWRGMACLRFMDWMHTNGSKIATWADRPTTDDATYTTKGVPLEVMIDLANRLRAAPWFCLPHLADDDFVTRFASLVKEKLDPRLKVYVEYSNEVWNGMFEQSRWAGREGIKLGFADKPWEAAWKYTGYRSAQVFALWEKAFGGRERLVRVLPSQAANPYVSERVVEFKEAYKQADALAIAPYVTCNVSPTGKPSAAEVEKWTVDQALDNLEQTALPQSIQWIRGNKKVADKYGLKLVAYEGGQHMVGVTGVENNDKITRLLHAANRHPRMGEIYARYFDAWAKEGGDLFCYFASLGRWSKWGSWGLLEYPDEDPKQSPKFMATMRWAKSLGQKVNLPE